MEERRLGDDLDRFVAGAAKLGGENARNLLDRGLGLAREAEQRALRHVAAERHDEHREEREIDLLHARLVGVARQVALRVVDLGADVGERRVGVEPRLELEQHVAAALEGRGAHLLDVLDRLQARLERLQDEPLGVFRADAALRDVHVDDRDRHVGLGFLRNRDIGDEARRQQEDQDGDRQPRMADRVIDGIAHVLEPLAAAGYEDFERSSAGALVASTGCTFCPSFTKSWPWTITMSPSFGPASQISSRASSTIDTGTEATMPSAPTVRTLSLPAAEKVEGGARHAHGRDRRELELHLRRHAVGDRVVGVVELDLDAVGAGPRARRRRDVAHLADRASGR